MGIQHSYDAAMLGYFVDVLARDGLVALAFANSISRSIALWGGKEPLFGTNPLAFSSNRIERQDVATGKAVLALQPAQTTAGPL